MIQVNKNSKIKQIERDRPSNIWFTWIEILSNRLKSQTNLQSSNIFKYTNLWTYDLNKQIDFQINFDRPSKFKHFQINRPLNIWFKQTSKPSNIWLRQINKLSN